MKFNVMLTALGTILAALPASAGEYSGSLEKTVIEEGEKASVHDAEISGVKKENGYYNEGAVWNKGEIDKVSGVTFEGNDIGLSNEGTIGLIENSHFTDNGDYGVVHVSDTGLEISGSDFTGNGTAVYIGPRNFEGSPYLSNTQKVYIHNTNFSGNDTGIALLNPSTLVLESVVFDENETAIDNSQSSSDLEIRNSKFTNNTTAIMASKNLDFYGENIFQGNELDIDMTSMLGQAKTITVHGGASVILETGIQASSSLESQLKVEKNAKLVLGSDEEDEGSSGRYGFGGQSEFDKMDIVNDGDIIVKNHEIELNQASIRNTGNFNTQGEKSYIWITGGNFLNTGLFSMQGKENELSIENEEEGVRLSFVNTGIFNMLGEQNQFESYYLDVRNDGTINIQGQESYFYIGGEGCGGDFINTGNFSMQGEMNQFAQYAEEISASFINKGNFLMSARADDDGGSSENELEINEVDFQNDGTISIQGQTNRINVGNWDESKKFVNNGNFDIQGETNEIEFERLDFLNTGTFTVQAEGTNNFSFEYGGTFRNDGTFTMKGSADSVFSLGNRYDTSSFLNTGIFDMQGVFEFGKGTFQNDGKFMLLGSLDTNGEDVMTVLNNGTITLQGYETEEDGASPSDGKFTFGHGTFTNNGTLNVLSGTFTHGTEQGDGFRFENNGKMRLGKESEVFLQDYVSNGGLLQIDLEVDPEEQTVTNGLITVEGDIVGTTNILVNAEDDKLFEGAYTLFLTAADDNPETASDFKVTRVYRSPYMWEAVRRDYGADFEETEDGTAADDDTPWWNKKGSDWYLRITDEENPNPTPDPDDEDNTPSSPVKKPVYTPEVIAGVGLHEAAIEQTRSVVRNVRNKTGIGREYCTNCGVLGYDWDGKQLRNIWVTAQGETASIKKPADMDADIWGVEAGFDIQNDANNTLGVFASYRKGEYDLSGKGSKIRSNIGSEIDIDSYLAGLYYRYDKNMNWVFATIYGGIQKADVKTDDKIATYDTDGIEFGASIEGGHSFGLSDSVTLDPSMGLYYTQVNFDDAHDNVGKKYNWSDIKHLEAEAGVSLTKQFDNAKVYVKPSVVQTLTTSDKVRVNNMSKLNTYKDGTLGRIELGGRYGFTDSLSGYGWANYTFGSGYSATAAGLGVSYSW